MKPRFYISSFIISLLILLAGLGGSPGSHFLSSAASLSILSWNTLSVGDTFASGWGCMGEIERRDELIASQGITSAEAEQALLSERFVRVASALESARLSTRVIAVQEADVSSVPGGEYLLKYFNPESSGWSYACKSNNSEEVVFITVDPSYITVLSNESYYDQANGILACSASISTKDSQEKITIFSLHLSRYC
jgi:hypothetical protein